MPARISTGILGAGGTNRLPSVPRNGTCCRTRQISTCESPAGSRSAEGQKIEAIVDIFNLLNRLNYTSSNALMYSITGTAAAPTLSYNPTFQSLTNANSNYFVFTPRQVQLALRYTF